MPITGALIVLGVILLVALVFSALAAMKNQAMVLFLSMSVGLVVLAGRFTHIYVSFNERLWGFLIAGAIFFPIAIVHGWGIWFGFWALAQTPTNNGMLFADHHKGRNMRQLGNWLFSLAVLCLFVVLPLWLSGFPNNAP
jgi:hypothetical protein